LTFCGNGGPRRSEGDVVTIDTTMTEADFSGKQLGVAGAQILAAFMSTKLFEAKGSLSKLDLSNNSIGASGQREGVTALSAALKTNSTITELSIASNYLGVAIENVTTFADALQDMGSLSKLDISGNNIGELVLPDGWTKGVNAAQTDYEFKHTDGTTQTADPSAACGVIALVKVLPDMGSLSELDLSKNNLRSEGLSTVSEALKSTSIKQLNIAENKLTSYQNYGTDMSGVIKFTEDMKDMGSLASLDISNNSIGSAQEAIIKQICAGRSIKCAL
jgi:Ran GTPase-activating protein (RanGAP) involved in mRNA processing and transport